MNLYIQTGEPMKLIAGGAVIAAMMLGALASTASAQNFDDAMKDQLINACRTDLPKRVSAELPDESVTVACRCIFQNIQTAPAEKEEMDWGAVLTAMQTGEVKATDIASMNAGMFASFYPATLQKPKVASCMESGG